MDQDKAKSSKERYPRYPYTQTVTFEVSAPLALQQAHEYEMDGITRNVSEGGLCFITGHALEEAQIIKVRVPVLNGAAVIPTLARVQWVTQQSLLEAETAVLQAAVEQNRKRYVVGLCFIL